MSTPKPVAYSEVVNPQDTQKAMQTVTVQLFPDDGKPFAVDFGGACPRCGHAIEIRQWLVAVSGALKMNDRQMQELAAHLETIGVDRSKGDQQFDLTCSCSIEHPHRPQDKHGCGARFRIHVVWP